jgi:hypothetical protein
MVTPACFFCIKKCGTTLRAGENNQDTIIYFVSFLTAPIRSGLVRNSTSLVMCHAISRTRPRGGACLKKVGRNLIRGIFQARLWRVIDMHASLRTFRRATWRPSSLKASSRSLYLTLDLWNFVPEEHAQIHDGSNGARMLCDADPLCEYGFGHGSGEYSGHAECCSLWCSSSRREP